MRLSCSRPSALMSNGPGSSWMSLRVWKISVSIDDSVSQLDDALMRSPSAAIGHCAVNPCVGVTHG